MNLLSKIQKQVVYEIENRLPIACFCPISKEEDNYKKTNVHRYAHDYNFGGNVLDVKANYFWMIDEIEKMRDAMINV